MKRAKIARLFRIEPGHKFRVRNHKTRGSAVKGLSQLSGDQLTEEPKNYVQKNLDYLATAQDLLYANDSSSVLIIFQAMDAAGKDGMIKHVMSGLNPQGC